MKQGVLWVVPAGLGIIGFVALIPPGLGTSGLGTSSAHSCAIYESSDTPLDISPRNSTVVSAINVPESFTLSDVKAGPFNISHTWVSDLDAYLVSPNSSRVELFTNVGVDGDDFMGTVLDDAADVSMSNGVAPFSGPHRPEEPLAKFAGEDAAGEWRLELRDTGHAAEAGTLDAWALELCRTAESSPTDTPPPPSPNTQSSPANDNFVDATVVAGLPYIDSLSVVGATVEAGEPTASCVFSYGSTVWYSFTPAQSDLLYITTAGSTYDTVVAAYTGSELANLTEVGCHDDTSTGLTSLLELQATSGTVYWIQIGSLGASPTQLNIRFEWAQTPANDNFADAVPALPQPYADTLTTILATAEVGEPLDCEGNLIGKTVWYSVVVPGPRVVTVTTEGSDYDTVLAVYRGSEVGALSQLVCNDDAGPAGGVATSEVEFAAVSGNTYWIQAGGWESESGTLILAVAQSSPPISDGDGDGLSDAAEVACGSNPSSASSVPERVDMAGDDDGDGLTNEALPAGAAAYDCDGDGYKGSVESHLTTSDQDPCGANGWPSDLLSGGIPANTLNIQDLASFLAPVRRLGTSPGHPDYRARWDLMPGSTIGAAINVADIAATVLGKSGYPPMFAGLRAYGRECPWGP